MNDDEYESRYVVGVSIEDGSVIDSDGDRKDVEEVGWILITTVGNTCVMVHVIFIYRALHDNIPPTIKPPLNANLLSN